MKEYIRVCSVDEEGRYGGPQQRTIEIAKGIIKYGIKTTVIFPKLDSIEFEDRLIKAKIDYHPFNLTRLSLEPKVFIKYIFTFLIETFQLFLYFKNKKYDIIQINGTPQYKGAIAGKLAGIKVVWIFEDTKMPKVIKLLPLLTL